MRLNTTVTPPFFPRADQSTVLQLGLQALDATTWMQRDTDFDQFYQHKLRTQKVFTDKVYAALPESQLVQAEFHQTLVEHLVADHRIESLRSTPFRSLWHSSLLVQEDICLLEPKTGGYIMTAASVCSPSNWKLEEKIGGDLNFIHKPVPDYADTLGDRVNRLFEKLKTDSPLLRYNWSIQNGNELFWRADLQESDQSIEPLWYWRVERQTLRRLPISQAIVFGIRIYLHNLASLCLDKQLAEHIHGIVVRLPDNQIQYKGLGRWLRQWQ
jgi:hypothetical protein